VVVTAIVSEELVATLLRLRDVGRRLVLISLDQEPPGRELEGILSYHLPGVEIDFRPPSRRGEVRGEFVQGRQAVETFTRFPDSLD